jgi:hypothetical protein
MKEKKQDAVGSNGKKVKRVRGEPILNYKPSTKILALLNELRPFSKRNPYSANYDPNEADADEIQEVDEDGRRVVSDIVKSVVLYVITYLFVAIYTHFFEAHSGPACWTRSRMRLKRRRSIMSD